MPSSRRCAALPALPTDSPIIDDSRPFYAFFLAKSPLCFIVGHGPAVFRPLTARGARSFAILRGVCLFSPTPDFPRDPLPPLPDSWPAHAPSGKAHADNMSIPSEAGFLGASSLILRDERQKIADCPQAPGCFSPKTEPSSARPPRAARIRHKRQSSLPCSKTARALCAGKRVEGKGRKIEKGPKRRRDRRRRRSGKRE